MCDCVSNYVCDSVCDCVCDWVCDCVCDCSSSYLVSSDDEGEVVSLEEGGDNVSTKGEAYSSVIVTKPNYILGEGCSSCFDNF